MDITNILNRVDHTLLKTNATWAQIEKVCDEALAYSVASVCIPPVFVKRASHYLNGQLPVCTVIGFPNGYATTNVKVYEAADAIGNGADEIDMVVCINRIKDGEYERVLKEINQVKEVCGPNILKVIIETCLLTKEEKIKMCEIVSKSDADYIKTSTGFGGEGATAEDIKLMKKYVRAQTKIKAAGGIATLEDAQLFLDLGADRLGSSRIIELVKAQDK